MIRTLLLVLSLVVGIRVAGARVTGDIYGPGSAQFPIAVVPLAGDAALGARFAKVLSRDLELSGYFRVVDPSRFPVESGDAIDWESWAATGAQALVRGTVSGGDGIVTEVRLWDVATKQPVEQVGKRYTGARNDVGRMANRTADAVLEFLTGERGPFDSKIAFASTRGGRLKDVWVFAFDRDEPEKLTNEQSIVLAPRWRPDLGALVYTSYREHYPHLFAVDLPGRGVRRLAGDGRFLSGAYGPDGLSILAAKETQGNADIVLLDASGRVLKQLTDHWGIDVSPAWAPDGRRFAFCSSRAGSPQIYVMGVDGGSPQRVSFQGSYNTSPAWSPKGDAIAWATRAGGGFQIVVARADGGGSRTIAEGEDPSWSPDGRYLVFARRGRLVFADRDGHTVKELTRGNGSDSSPSWSPRLDQGGR